MRLTLKEADAFHIVAYSIIEAINDVFLRHHRDRIRPAVPDSDQQY